MATTLGTVVRFGFGGTVTLYDPDGTTAVTSGPVAVGAIQSGTITHDDDSIEVKDKDGKVVSHVAVNNDRLTLNITAVLSGNSSANAALSASLPLGNGRATITGCPVIAMGPWADAINTNTASTPNTYLWIYAGGGQVSLNNDGTASLTASFKRYANVASASSDAAVSV
jgi:hypothetical protein